MLIWEVKSTRAQKRSKEIDKEAYVHSNYCSLVTIYHSASPHASICYQVWPVFFLHFLAFTTGHCQRQSLKLDGPCYELVSLFWLFIYLEYNTTNNITNTVFNSKKWYWMWSKYLHVCEKPLFFSKGPQIKFKSHYSHVWENLRNPWWDPCWWDLLSLASFDNVIASYRFHPPWRVTILASIHSYLHRQNLHLNDVLPQFQAFGRVVFQRPFIKLKIPEEEQ